MTQTNKIEKETIDTNTLEKKSTKKKIIFGAVGTLAFLAVASIGSVTYAATTTTTNTGTFLERVATIVGVDSTKLKSAVSQVSTEEVDKKLAAGEITSDQATKMKEAIANGDSLMGFGGGPRGGKGRGMMMDRDALATFLGLTTDQLETKEHTDGQTLLQIAQAQGKTEEQLKTYLSEQFDKNLADAVTNNKITSDQATKMKENKDTMISKMMTEVRKRGQRPDAPANQTQTPTQTN